MKARTITFLVGFLSTAVLVIHLYSKPHSLKITVLFWSFLVVISLLTLCQGMRIGKQF
jgi:hypothetical protein